MTKILLLELPIDPWDRWGHHYLPNPGTLAIATFMRSKGYDVRLVDTYASGIKWDQLPSLIRQESPDIVGSSSYTPDIYGRILLCRQIKQIDPSIITVLGGPHATLMPEETLRLAKDLDYVVRGEGEETFLELTQNIEDGRSKREMRSVKGISFLDGEEYVQTENRPLIEDLDTLPMPDYSLLPMDKYRNSYFPGPPQQGFSCYFSRGCKERCNFCSENILWQHQWRSRSAKLMVEEFKLLYEKYGKRYFLLGDDNFFFSRERNVAFIEEMKSSKLDVKFRAGVRVDTLLKNRDLLKPFREVGLIALQVGLESYEQKNLNSMRKGYGQDQIREVSEVIKEAGIPFPRIFIVIGNREDDRGSIKNVVKATKENGFSSVQISTLVPWPGTGFFEEMRASGAVKVWDYRAYDFGHAILETKHLTASQVDWEREKLFYRLHFDPQLIMRNMKNEYLRHFYLYTIFSLHWSAIVNKLVEKFRFGDSYVHNRRIDGIYREHLAYLKQKRTAVDL